MLFAVGFKAGVTPALTILLFPASFEAGSVTVALRVAEVKVTFFAAKVVILKSSSAAAGRAHNKTADITENNTNKNLFKLPLLPIIFRQLDGPLYPQ
jgi:hypothetical protein